MWFSRQKVRPLILLFCFVWLLAGCAQSWSARVLQFEQWPVDTQGATYALELTSEQQNSHEIQAIADAVRAAIGQVGLSEGEASTARFVVMIDFEISVKRKWVHRYVDLMCICFGGFGGGYYGQGWAGGIGYWPRPIVVPVDVYENVLSVRITDRKQDNKEVYRATAISEAIDEDFLQQISNLALAVFEDFPGLNGQSRIVEKRIEPN